MAKETTTTVEKISDPPKPPKHVPTVNEKIQVVRFWIRAIIAMANLPSIANLIDVNPIQIPIKVTALGNSILVFLSETILNLFFCCSINYFLAIKVSPEIALWPILTNGL